MLGEAQGVDIAPRLELRQYPRLDIVPRQRSSAFHLTQHGVVILDEVLQGVLDEAQSAFRLTGGVTQRGVRVLQCDACAVRVSGI